MRIAAFFDLDGTLLPAPSLERRFLRYLRWREAIGVCQWARWLTRFCCRVWRDPLAATDGNKVQYARVPTATLAAWTAWLRAPAIPAASGNHATRRDTPFFPQALARMEWHAVHGHSIFLVSGTLRPLAEAVARRLPLAATVCATELECSNGRWTGELVGDVICGPGKARALDRLAAQFQLDLSRSYAYGDRYSDHWMLERVGHPAAVNPSLRLAHLAHRRGWPQLHWQRSEESNDPAFCRAGPQPGRDFSEMRITSARHP